MHDDWRTLNRSFTWTNHGEQMTESPVAVEESHRLRAPLPSRRATTRQNQTYKQIKHADRTRRSLIKDMHDWRGQPQIYLSIRLEPQGESGPSPSRRPMERERFSNRGQPPREREVRRRIIEEPPRERESSIRRRSTEREASVSSTSHGEGESRCFFEEIHREERQRFAFLKPKRRCLERKRKNRRRNGDTRLSSLLSFDDTCQLATSLVNTN